MATDYTATNIGSGVGQQSTINAEWAAIQAALERVLNVYGDSTNGTNAMQVDLNMNSQKILNVPAPTLVTDLVRLGDLSTADAADALTTILNDAGGNYTSDNVEGALTEIAASLDALAAGTPVFSVAGGTVDAITASLTPAITSYTDGMQINVRAAGANATTAPTLNIDSVGAKTIKKIGNEALRIGDIPKADYECIFRYNSTNDVFELLNPALYPPLSGEIGVTSYEYEYDDPKRWGVVADGSTDDRAAWALADTGNLYGLKVRHGSSVIASDITISSDIYFEYGASLLPSSAVTVTFTGAVEAGQYTVWDYANGGDFDLHEAGYVYNISHFTGSSFNAKWDNLRTNLKDGYHYTLLVPIPKKGESGAVAVSADKWHWEVTGEITLDTKENNSHWITHGQFYVTAAITNCFNFGATTKTEDIDFAHPIWINVDTGGSGSCTNALNIQGMSRLTVPLVTVNNCTNAVTIDPANVVSYIEIANIQAGVDCCSLNIDVTASSATNITIGTAQSEVHNSAGNTAVTLSGPIRNLLIDRVLYNKNTGVKITNAVVIENNSYGAMTYLNRINEVYANDATTAVRIQDTTSAVGNKTVGMEIGFIGAQGTDAALNADYCEDCTLHDWLPGQTVTIGSASERMQLNPHRANGSTIADSGGRTIINKMGEQARSTGVEPQSGYFKIGETVFNTNFPDEVWLKIKDTGTDSTDFMRLA